MKRLLSLMISLPVLLVWAACNDAPTVVSGDAKTFLADQHYYPSDEGTFWRYRIDTTGVSGGTIRDVGRRTARMFGKIRIDSLDYAVQTNETVSGITTTNDNVYIRHSDQGVFLSSPQLQDFGRVIPFLSSFPKEIQIIPASLETSTSWSILNFEFTQIPLFPIYFRVTAAYLNRESVQIDMGTFRDCIKIRVDIDARFPNPQTPQDLLNPLIIKESANFWLSRPIGLVMGDGSEVVFSLLEGRLPLNIPRRRMHQELLGYDIVQPNGSCPGGPR
jgi:hypothetical protein